MSALSLPNVDHIVHFEVSSLSRAGRNEAAHKTLTRKAAEQMEIERAAKKAAIRKKNRELAAETFEANNFGEGNTQDKKREEMCSSPRLHPQRELQAKRDYRGQRLGVFQSIHQSVPRLDLVDVGAITAESEKQYKEGKTPRTAEEEEELGNPESPLLGQDQMADMGDIPIPHPPASSVKKEKEKAKLEAVVSPLRSRKAIPHDSASFLSPSRWIESGAPKPPAVGHYRPKHSQVEHRISHGLIQPPGAHTARARPDYSHLKGGEKAVAQSARGVVSSGDLGKTTTLSDAGLEKGGKSSQMLLDDDASPTLKKQSAPAPDKHSTSAFKSASPNRKGPLPTAGADAIYWPRNDNATSSRSTSGGHAVVSFSKMKGREPMLVKTAAPDATYPLTSSLATQCRVDMNRQAVRPPLSLPGAEETGTQYYDSGEAKDRMKFKTAPLVDFAQTSPRKPLDHGKPSVSVEAIEGDLSAFLKRAPKVPILDRMAGRPDNKVHINDLMYSVNDEQTSPRIRGAVVREGQGTGHKPLFNKTITDKCNYEPDPTAVRPKVLRTIEFSKDTPRPKNLDSKIKMADLVYNTETDLVKKRVQGNPMLSSHLTRGKRNKVLSPRAYAPDMIYNVEGLGGVMGKVRDDKGSIDFSKHVPREVVFKGRGQPSEKWLDAHPRAPGPGSYDVHN